jgi:hypothetical protein
MPWFGGLCGQADCNMKRLLGHGCFLLSWEVGLRVKPNHSKE